jgi:hypothetical protein
MKLQMVMQLKNLVARPIENHLISCSENNFNLKHKWDFFKR